VAEGPPLCGRRLSAVRGAGGRAPRGAGGARPSLPCCGDGFQCLRQV